MKKYVKVTVQLNELTKNYKGCKELAENFLKCKKATYNKENETYTFIKELWERYGFSGLAGIKRMCEIYCCKVLKRQVIDNDVEEH